MPVKVRNAVIWAFALYIVWTAATWFLEGRIHTLLRPEAVADRLIYVVVANLVIGIVGALLVLKLAISSGGAKREHTGFGSRSPSIPWIVVGIALGLALYFVQGAPSTNPMVILNAYAQVFVVSVAEVLVCWALVGGVLQGAFGGSRWTSAAVAAVIASVLFGIYHFAHSPPFDTIGMVALLTAVGLLTSAFFFASRDVYATIAFHNFLGVYGVVQALVAADKLGGFAAPRVPLLATAIVSLLILIAADVLIVRRSQALQPGTVR
ncbi:CPBP family glutamic-type intramembrane protease [Chelativorans xinjiangense]|uniref:CPBP family glutamic-type intramembrane protease n=1 Tax=Chelativorans xinjiangense TaxID=2681485 RepID=UPI001357D7B4|nr:CPBP family glutamic-type intramembrane protease [Chelativorans xinjiangense]